MKYRTLRILSIFSALSLVGILITQTFWLRSSVELASKQFNHRADQMLEDVLNELKTYADTSMHIRGHKELGTLALFDIVDTILLDKLILKYSEYHHLDSILRYALIVSDSKKIIYNRNNFEIKDEAKAYKVCLSCIWQKEYIHLSVYFPNKQRDIILSLILWIFLSVVFMIATVGAFIFILFSIFRQKKIAEIKNDFINNMTHELKTPISTISVAAEVLMKKDAGNDNPERVSRYSKIIYDENHRMQKLVEKVLNIATLERELITIEREEIDIHSIIFKSVESFRFEFCHKTVEVAYHFDATNPVILADKVHIRNIINNLIDNAVKYSDDIPKIEIKTCNLEGFIQIEISDKGKGIPKELQKKVFDKFYRGHSGNVHNVKGFGLGLYYAKTTVELHGGKIDLDSSPNQGTRMIILLPQ